MRVKNMRLITSMSHSASSRATPHLFLATHKQQHQTSLSSYHPTRSFNSLKFLSVKSRSFSNGRTCSVSKFGMIPRSDQMVIKRQTLSSVGCGCYFVRRCSTAASVVPSSLGPLVLGTPSVVVTCELTHSDVPQKSEEWFALRRDKLTTSTFSTALGFWKGNRRNELWQEKVFTPDGDTFSAAARSAMNWGVLNETVAIERYKSITSRDVSFLGFATHSEEKFHWLGASPDGMLEGCSGGGGILEVKCPYNKGKPELGLPWSTVPFYYMPQVQGQMEILDREWVDLYCWTPNGSTIFRVCRERGYWELIHGILREFWWDNVIPAKELMLLGKEEDAKVFKPSSTHRQTGLAIAKSINLAAESKLLCREIAGHVEFF